MEVKPFIFTSKILLFVSFSFELNHHSLMASSEKEKESREMFEDFSGFPISWFSVNI